MLSTQTVYPHGGSTYLEIGLQGFDAVFRVISRLQRWYHYCR